MSVQPPVTYGIFYLRFRWSRLRFEYGRRVYRTNRLGFLVPCEWEWENP